MKNVLNTSESDIKLNANYKFDESTDSQLKGGISFRNKNFELDGQNNVIDGSNQAGVFIFHNCTVTIRNLKIINAVDALYMDTESTVTTINITFENNTDSSYGAAVCADRSVYSSYNDTFINNNAKFGSAIYLTDTMATISNATFRNDDEIEWSLIYSDDQCSIIKLMDCEFSNLRSKYATVVYNAYQTEIQRCRFINLTSISAGAIALKGYASFDGYTALLEVYDCQFINVSSSKNSGAILADFNGMDFFDEAKPYYGELIIKDSIFDNCRSLFGGAIAQFGGDLTINNTNFTNNNATYIGGAIYASNVSSKIFECLFENNTAVKDTFFETGDESNRLSEGFGKFNSGAIYSDTGYSWIGSNIFINNTGALSLYSNPYYVVVGNNFIDNGIAIKTYFDFADTVIQSNTFNNDKNSLYNVFYDLNIDETGREIPYNPVEINDANADSQYFDLRDYGLVSPVENQGRIGACWAFGAAGALESAFLKGTGYYVKLNISENNLKGIMLAYSILGKRSITEGAAIGSPIAYLLSYIGIANESQDSFDELGKVSPIFLNKNSYHIQNLLMIPKRNASNPEQSAEIDRQLKEALIKYGAVTVYLQGTNSGEEGYNNVTYSQFVGQPDAKGDHFVTLVGWDDNYSKENFLPYEVKDEEGHVIGIKNVERNGAWIIKNSWGTEFGDEGFYYVSYDDTSFATSYSVAYIINQTPSYITVYQYDFDFIDYIPVENNYTVYYLADKDEIISAVGTYFNGIGIDYTISVLVGYNDLFAYSQSGKSLYPGYQTIDLAKQIAVKKGEQFAISIKTSLAPYLLDSKVVFDPGRSLFDDWEGVTKQGIIPCLKAYTFANPLSAKANYLTGEKFTLTGPAGEVVIVEYDGTNASLTFDSNGKAIFTKALKSGNSQVNVYYNGTKVSYPIHVFKSVSIASSRTAAFNTHIVIDSYFKDLNDLPLTDKYITVKFDGQTVKLPVGANGYLGITLDDFRIGSHTLTVINPSTGESAKCIVKIVSRFSGNKNIVMDYYNGTRYQLRVYGNNGKVVGAGQVVTIKLNKKTYKVKTNKYGWAILKIPYTVTPKKYTITATYKGQTVKNTITVKRTLKSSNRILKKSAKKFIFRASLRTSKNKAIRGKVVKFRFYGRTYSAKTNSRGIAQVTIKKAVIKKLKKGRTYKVAVTYLRDTIKRNVKVRA